MVLKSDTLCFSVNIDGDMYNEIRGDLTQTIGLKQSWLNTSFFPLICMKWAKKSITGAKKKKIYICTKNSSRRKRKREGNMETVQPLVVPKNAKTMLSSSHNTPNNSFGSKGKVF